MANQDWFDKDFYKSLGVASDASETRHQEGLPQAGQGPAPGQEPGRRRRRAAVQGGQRGLLGALRRRPAQGVRRGPGDVPGRRPVHRRLRAVRRLLRRRVLRLLLPPVRPAAPATAAATSTWTTCSPGCSPTAAGPPASAAGGAARPDATSRRPPRSPSGRRSRATRSRCAARTAPRSPPGCRPGVRDGQKIRLRGKGNPGPGGNGDLILTVTVEPHPLFGRDGDNLTVTVPVTFPEAALGAQIEVPTFDGSTRDGEAAGRAPRPAGRCGSRARASSARTAPAGDLLVNVSVAVPQKLDGAGPGGGRGLRRGDRRR